MNTDLHGQVALVTGASKGVGKGIALQLARYGASVVVNYNSDLPGAEATAAEIRGMGVTATVVQGHVGKAHQVDAMFEQVRKDFGHLDILVNNAGVGAGGPFAATTEAAYDAVFAITKGVFFTLQAAMQVVSDNGRIVNFSSGLTRNWAPAAAAYAGSKAAVEQFTRSLSKELGPRGITVNVVLPGVIETDMTANMPAERREHSRQQTSFGRLGQPEDIADVVAFLASDDARWITGESVNVTGGQEMH